jgi:CBS domain-containing protein
MAGTTLVREIMSTDVKSLGPNEAIADAADKLAEAGVGAMPVVDGANHLLPRARAALHQLLQRHDPVPG